MQFVAKVGSKKPHIIRYKMALILKRTKTLPKHFKEMTIFISMRHFYVGLAKSLHLFFIRMNFFRFFRNMMKIAPHRHGFGPSSVPVLVNLII